MAQKGDGKEWVSGAAGIPDGSLDHIRSGSQSMDTPADPAIAKEWTSRRKRS
jgi:hypothetical protein